MGKAGTRWAPGGSVQGCGCQQVRSCCRGWGCDGLWEKKVTQRTSSTVPHTKTEIPVLGKEHSSANGEFNLCWRSPNLSINIRFRLVQTPPGKSGYTSPHYKLFLPEADRAVGLNLEVH